MKTWALPPGIPLEHVLSWCLRERAVDRLLLAMRLQKDERGREVPEPEVEDLIDSLFGDKILMRKKARRWPGTELVGHEGVVFLVSFDSSLIEPMVQAGELLHDWRHGNRPRLPEDPCLFRAGDEWPVLVTVTHERDAWILSEDRPSLCFGEPFDFNPKELLVPTAAEGFIGA
jgi:hypothetical protein